MWEDLPQKVRKFSFYQTLDSSWHRPPTYLHFTIVHSNVEHLFCVVTPVRFCSIFRHWDLIKIFKTKWKYNYKSLNLSTNFWLLFVEFFCKISFCLLLWKHKLDPPVYKKLFPKPGVMNFFPKAYAISTGQNRPIT